MKNLTSQMYWANFAQENKLSDSYQAWSFGNTAEMADELVELVLRGEKTATTSAYPSYQVEGEEIPKVGEYSVVLDGAGQPKAIIRTTKIELIPYNQISEEYAFLEGEGDKSLAYWQAAHETFFRETLEEAGLIFTQEMLCVCEYFECVYK
ncbi:RNA-binding protein [Enterococcus sp. JM4C]|uniref:ASCH domain-containing protein n=1 Tax=Candidatus Enterococcus huntleyi TaxID=1857217 RepID=UPI0013799A50|nr:ASCH domain-containing protein [Enterococcus sp. JM4C]KAF1296804.1 RNA-binding protein [Enterococcus sp. JM4C]